VKHNELTIQEAAELLHFSPSHLVKLVDDGAFPHGLGIDAVLDYRKRRARIRRDALDKLTRLSEELDGGYR
jgi:hypothetical protein